MFEKKKVEPVLACNRTINLLVEFELAGEREEPPPKPEAQEIHAWQPPHSPLFKVNVDAAVTGSKFGLGMVVRDEVGDVLMSAGSSCQAEGDPLHAEAKAMFFGFKYAFDVGFRSIVMESDCANLVQLAMGKTRVRTRTQVIVDDILALAPNFEYCLFVFAIRSCNRVAHSIAKSSLTLEEVVVWMEDHPLDVLPLVLADKPFE